MQRGLIHHGRLVGPGRIHIPGAYLLAPLISTLAAGRSRTVLEPIGSTRFAGGRQLEESCAWLRKQELEPRLADLERVDYQPVDLEAATTAALAYLARFRDVLEEGTLEQRKEFLRGFVHEIAIDPDAARGTITFYELPVTSLMSVPGARVAPTSRYLPRADSGRMLEQSEWGQRKGERP